jgi:hydrogenase maturation protease
MPKVAVVGLGNVLIGDDAFGPYVVRLFEARYEAGSDVVALDLGTPGLDLAPHLEGLEALIVVDTVSSDGPPGTLELYGKDDLLSRPAPRRTDPHQLGELERLGYRVSDRTPPGDPDIWWERRRTDRQSG